MFFTRDRRKEKKKMNTQTINYIESKIEKYREVLVNESEELIESEVELALEEAEQKEAHRLAGIYGISGLYSPKCEELLRNFCKREEENLYNKLRKKHEKEIEKEINKYKKELLKECCE